MSERIVFNALLASPAGAGVSRYALELGRRLAALRGDVLLAVRDKMAERFGVGAERLLIFRRVGPAWRRTLAEQVSLPLKARQCALLHYPEYTSPLLFSPPMVITLHDLAFFRHPETFTRAQGAWKRFLARRSARKALRVICVSNDTAKDAREMLGIPEEIIRVVYPGVTVYTGVPQPPKAQVPKGPFILFTGMLQPRKNLVRLVEAFALLRKAGFALRLFLAGGKGWMWQAVFDAIRRHRLEGQVTWLGHCNDAELKWLYGRASALVYPSIHEGFGFPPLEAMANDLPVVASNVGSIPEVCGEAAHYVDPLSVEDIARGTREVCGDAALRKRLIEGGRQRVRAFDWDACARAVSAVYDELLVAY